jgi:PAS domain S-box-containing protein
MNEDFSTLINSSPMAITATDLQGRIQLWNPAAERLLGYSAEDVIGRYPPHVTEDTKAEFHDLTARVGRGETIRNLEIRRRRKDGKLIDIAIWLAPRYDTAGRIRGILTIQQDVTEQKEMERRYLQAQKMEAVGRLTGGVAHDFNNLLGIVISNVDLLLARDLAQGQKGILDDILSAAMRGADLTRQLLSFSRRQPLSPEAADANAVVASLSNMAKRMLGDHIEVALALSDGVWPAMVDVGQLETAILNLCVNARDAMPGGGRLTIATSNFANPTDGDARVQELEPGDYVRIQVADSGSGMPPDVAARAFEPFFTTKAVGAGSGLGLSMVYGFAKQSGGHAAIESKPGQGTQVSLYVPRASESVPKARSSGLAPSAPRGKETVLVVEDNDQLRRVLTRQLTELGYRTLEAANGDSALAALQNAPGIDVLFTDVMMPGTLNGHDLIREAMRLRPELKVLMTSGYDGALTQMRPKDLPAHIGMLPKPFRKDELARAIRACLDRPTLH